MKKALLYFLAGTVVSVLINYFTSSNNLTIVDFYKAVAFGLGWGLAYYVDRPEWPLFRKLGISFIGIIILVLVGIIFFDFETAVPSIIKLSTVFVAYYMIASFRESKSLRS